MIIVGVDPGYTHSGWVVYDSGEHKILLHSHESNAEVLVNLQSPAVTMRLPDVVVFEQIVSYGMPVGIETLDTCFWTGVLYQAASAAGARVDRLPRKAVKLHLCGSMKAKDTNIRQALLDRFGGSSAIGKKSAKGPLYGLRSHEFAALAVAITWADTHKEDWNGSI